MIGIGTHIGHSVMSPGSEQPAQIADLDALLAPQISTDEATVYQATLKNISRQLAVQLSQILQAKSSSPAQALPDPDAQTKSLKADAVLSGVVRTTDATGHVELETNQGLVTLRLQAPQVRLQTGQSLLLSIPEPTAIQEALKQSPVTPSQGSSQMLGGQSPTLQQLGTNQTTDLIELAAPVTVKLSVPKSNSARLEASAHTGNLEHLVQQSPEKGTAAELKLSSHLKPALESELKLGPVWSEDAPAIELKPGARVHALTLATTAQQNAPPAHHLRQELMQKQFQPTALVAGVQTQTSTGAEQSLLSGNILAARLTASSESLIAQTSTINQINRTENGTLAALVGKPLAGHISAKMPPTVANPPTETQNSHLTTKAQSPVEAAGAAPITKAHQLRPPVQFEPAGALHTDSTTLPKTLSVGSQNPTADVRPSRAKTLNSAPSVSRSIASVATGQAAPLFDTASPPAAQTGSTDHLLDTRLINTLKRDANVIHKALKESPNLPEQIHHRVSSHLNGQSHNISEQHGQSRILDARGAFVPLHDPETWPQASSAKPHMQVVKTIKPAGGNQLGSPISPVNMNTSDAAPNRNTQFASTTSKTVTLTSAAPDSAVSELEILSLQRPSQRQDSSEEFRSQISHIATGKPASQTPINQAIKSGQINGVAAGGRPILRSGIETLVLNTQLAPPDGTEVTFRTLSDNSRLQVHGDVNLSLSGAENPAFARDQSWRTLETMIAQLAAHDPTTLAQIRAFALPQPGRDLTSQLVLMLFALRKGGAKAWLGSSSLSALDKIGAGSVARRIRAEFPTLRRDGPERLQSAGQVEWKPVLLPLETQEGLCPVTFEWHRDREETEDLDSIKQTSDAFHFRLSFETSHFGAIKVGGVLKDRELRLEMYTQIELCESDQHELSDLINSAAAIFEIRGQIAFRSERPEWN